MINTLSRMIRTGILTEETPQAPKESLAIGGLQENIRKILGRALCIRHVDAGSCNGCELEIQALNNPYYNIEGIGIKFVASPRHADLASCDRPGVGEHGRSAQEDIRRCSGSKDRHCGWRLWHLRRNLRQELRQQRRHCECHSGQPFCERLPSLPHGNPPGDPANHPANHHLDESLSMNKDRFETAITREPRRSLHVLGKSSRNEEVRMDRSLTRGKIGLGVAMIALLGCCASALF